jgi:vacuolar-type H+-ATPase subunit H
MFRNLRSKETSQSAMATSLKPNNRDKMSNASQEATNRIRKTKREYLKDRTNELSTDSKNKNIRNLYGGLNEFRSA